ncbi:MAG: hypothetical protein IPH44_06225 [Myxococcales bacterium]|nr:hypothetical protein [Myxococcales bacterium]
MRRISMMSGRLTLVLAVAALACRGEARGQPTPGAAGAPAPSSAARPVAARPGASAAVGRADVRGQVIAVGIASRVGASGAADATPKRAKLGEDVTLFAVLEVDDGGTRTVYSDAPRLTWKKKSIAPRPLAEAPAVTLAWAKLEPTEANLSNTASGNFRYERIPYAATPLDARGGAIAADVHPTLTPDHGHGLGTMRYQLTATQGDRVVASPGVDARRARAAGGLTDDVQRVTLRKDDTFIGYLTEMMGQPYIWASAGPSDKAHQSEHLEGSDCADLMVYAARRAGFTIPYGWTGSLKQHARVLASGALADDGVYRDRNGVPVPFPAPGDLILFPRHVGALTVDRGTIGVVDVDDLMIHTLFDSPKEQALRDSGYADNPIEILRWKKR